MMFEDLIKENGIAISQRDMTFVKALIGGDPGRCKCVNVFL